MGRFIANFRAVVDKAGQSDAEEFVAAVPGQVLVRRPAGQGPEAVVEKPVGVLGQGDAVPFILKAIGSKAFVRSWGA